MRVSLEKSNAGNRYGDCAFRNFERRAGTEKALAAAMEVAEDEKGRGIILSGKPGVGKSHLAAAVRSRNAERGVLTIMHDTVELMADFKSASHTNPEEYERNLLSCITVPVLILDDFDKLGAGMRDGVLSRFVGEATYRLINGRYKRKGQIVLTLNSQMGSVEARFGDDYGAAIVSRLLEMCRYVVVEAKDYRLNGVRP